MKRDTIRWSLVVFAILALFLRAYTEQQPAPTVTFTCDFPGSDPSHYALSVSSDAHASYISDGKLTTDAESGEPFALEFNMPQATLTRIFELAKKSQYFQGEIDSKKKNIASTGQKTLTYKDSQRNNSANYNYSPVPAVQELTAVFQDLSITLEFGRRLEYDHRYQKLALDQELRGMNEVSNRGELGDVAVIAPILQKIVEDPSVVNGARARAQRLLSQVSASGK
ncbi:MAG TPA: hypothetical protein VEH30_02220 [Terriglobales bacterium]|nr:hypothetical protein [Terriglobales bacterium]